MNYRYDIALMTWSFSRLRAYEDCGYRFLLRYIYNEEEMKHFYSEYGSLMHHVLEKFYSGKIDKLKAMSEFICGFANIESDVKTSTALSWYEQGKDYLAELTMPEEKIIGVEEKVEFDVGGYPFVGFIDLLLEDSGDLIIEDHKSRTLKSKSFTRGTITEEKSNKEFDLYARQLYLYAAAVEQKYGKLPKELRFNCFRSGKVLTEPFDTEKFKEAKRWAVNTIHRIESEEEWNPSVDWFACNQICGFSETCEFARML